MRLVKMFGLAAMGALVAMALASAPSAMAESTALCDQDSAGACPSGHLVTHVHQATLFGAKAKVLSIITVECDVLFLGDTTESLTAGGWALEIIGSYTYTNCGKSCTVEDVSVLGSSILIQRLGHETGDVTSRGGLSEMFVDCDSFLECEYDGQGLLGTALGPLLSSETNGSISITNQVLHKTVGGFFCPKEAKLDIVLTPLSATYITT